MTKKRRLFHSLERENYVICLFRNILKTGFVSIKPYLVKLSRNESYFTFIYSFLSISWFIAKQASPIPSMLTAESVLISFKEDKTVTAIPIAHATPFNARTAIL